MNMFQNKFIKRSSGIMSAIAVLVMSMLFLTSCGTDAPEITKSIPDDAAMVVSVDLKNLSSKIPKDEFEQTFIYKMMMAKLDEAPPAISEMLKGIVTDFSTTGINQDSRMYIFNHAHNEMMYFCGISELSDAAKFEEMLTTVSEQAGLSIEKSGELSYLAPDDEGILAWTPKMMFVGATDDWATKEDNVKLAETLLGGKLKNSLTSNDNFSEFLSKGFDIGMWMDISTFFDIMKENMPVANIPFFPMPGKDSYSQSFINFEAGEVVVTSQSYITGRMNEIVKFIGESVDKDFIEYVPGEKLLGLFALKINLETVFENPNFGPIIGEAAKTINMTEDEITGMLGGDILLSWNGFQEVEIWEGYKEQIPDLMFGLKVTNMDAFDKLFEMVKMQMGLEEKDGYYVADAGLMIDKVAAYMVKTDDAFFGGMDEEIIKKIAAGEKGSSSPMKDMVLANASSNGVLMHLTAEGFDDEVLEGFDVDSDMEKDMVKKVLSEFEYLDVAASGTSSKSVLSLSNKDDNSLLAFMKMIDTFAAEVASQGL